jgi:hypothetical protein
MGGYMQPPNFLRKLPLVRELMGMLISLLPSM